MSDAQSHDEVMIEYVTEHPEDAGEVVDGLQLALAQSEQRVANQIADWLLTLAKSESDPQYDWCDRQFAFAAKRIRNGEWK